MPQVLSLFSRARELQLPKPARHGSRSRRILQRVLCSNRNHHMEPAHRDQRNAHAATQTQHCPKINKNPNNKEICYFFFWYSKSLKFCTCCPYHSTSQTTFPVPVSHMLASGYHIRQLTSRDLMRCRFDFHFSFPSSPPPSLLHR